jgi:MSHA biogenesis protein MshP
MSPRTTRQSGFAAIAAIFLLVVLAALGGFMLMLSNTQQISAAQDTQGTRVFWAARAGLEWGIASTVASSNCPASPTSLSLDGMTVTVTCQRNTYLEAGSNRNLFTFESRAFTPSGSVGSVAYTERSVSATLER